MAVRQLYIGSYMTLGYKNLYHRFEAVTAILMNFKSSGL